MVIIPIDLVEGWIIRTLVRIESENWNTGSDTSIDRTNFNINEIEIESDQVDIEGEIEEVCVEECWRMFRLLLKTNSIFSWYVWS